MEALDVLLYIYLLLTTYGNITQTPDEANITHEHILHMYALYLELDREEKPGPRKRRFWVRPIFQVNQRIAQGASDNLLWEMECQDREKYLQYIRMNKKMFKTLLRMVTPYIQKQHTIREPIPPHTRLHICLRYLASGDSMTSVSFAFRVSPNTVSKIVKETCTAIWSALKHSAFPRFATEGWYQIANDFEEKWNFDHCIGAVDGKQVLMQAPPNTGSTYYNYKERFGINLMAVSDAHYRFIAIDIGAPGRRSDGGVFKESRIGRRFEKGNLDVPPSNSVDERGTILPYVLVGDEAFSLSHYLMRPYPRRGILNRRKKIFNYRLSRARRVVESAFGILGARWRIYRTAIIGSTQLVKNIIQATTCLHNWIITESLKKAKNADRDLYAHLTPADRALPVGALHNFEDQDEIVQHAPNQLNPMIIRDRFAEYFESDSGAIPWQFEKVLQNEF